MKFAVFSLDTSYQQMTKIATEAIKGADASRNDTLKGIHANRHDILLDEMAWFDEIHAIVTV